eukprot:TRINITY_DN790_c0_g1_i14.p1 TRINITY_DN790_c0_g1~~TRINITY_DN790_c0_g1_i14.p1  ORF type:complete len:208 (+),score=93.81 TRINITY_DN790_c0_g1_i14:1-624(+)
MCIRDSCGITARASDNRFFFFSSRRRHTRQESVSWARRCVQETAPGINRRGVIHINLLFPKKTQKKISLPLSQNKIRKQGRDDNPPRPPKTEEERKQAKATLSDKLDKDLDTYFLKNKDKKEVKEIRGKQLDRELDDYFKTKKKGPEDQPAAGDQKTTTNRVVSLNQGGQNGGDAAANTVAATNAGDANAANKTASVVQSTPLQKSQ